MKNNNKSKIISLMLISILFSTTFSVNAIQNKNDYLKQDVVNNKDNVEDKMLSDGRYDLLIIAPKVFSRYILPLVHHKNKFGVNTILVDVEDVYKQMYWQGRDKAEKIKYFIKESIEQWDIKYVLLIGGRKNQGPWERWWIPVRYSHLDRKYDDMAERKFLTDLYFADIYDSKGNFSSWDDDKDGIFGEWPENQPATDKPDLYPDVYLGRLPCLNALEVRIIVRKIINYETGKCSDSWFNTMVVVAGDTYPEKTDYYDGEVYTQKGLDMMPDFNHVKLWASDGSLKNWVDVVTAINKGCGFIWFSGHGNPKLWATYPPDDTSNWIYGLRLRNMLFLRNRNKLPVCITGSGCFNSMFNASLGNSPWIYGLPTPHCFSWALTIRRKGGSIATIGSTAFSYESPDISRGEGGCEWLDMHFFEQYGQKGTDILGKCWGDTITGFLQNFTIDWEDATDTGDALIAKNCELWLLIGDPSLKIGGYPL